MINLISVDKKKSSNETKLQKATDGGRSRAQQPTHQLHVHARAAEAKIAEAMKAEAMEAEARKATIAFVPDQERIPRTSERTSERTPRTKERLRQRILERRTNFRKNLIWEKYPVKTAVRIPERYEKRFTLDKDEDMEWMDPSGTVET